MARDQREHLQCAQQRVDEFGDGFSLGRGHEILSCLAHVAPRFRSIEPAGATRRHPLGETAEPTRFLRSPGLACDVPVISYTACLIRLVGRPSKGICTGGRSWDASSPK